MFDMIQTGGWGGIGKSDNGLENTGNTDTRKIIQKERIPLQIRDFGLKTTKTRALSLMGKAFSQNKTLILTTILLSEHFLLFNG